MSAEVIPYALLEEIRRLNYRAQTQPRDAHARIKRRANIVEVRCKSCDLLLAPRKATLFHFPQCMPLWVCEYCALYTAFDVDPTVQENLAQFPRPDMESVSGREIAPYDYQVIDATKVSRMRSILINHEQGCGKSIITALGGIRLDAPNLVICPINAIDVWEREITRWRHDVEVMPTVRSTNYNGPWPPPGEVLIAPYSRIPDARCEECQRTKAMSCDHLAAQAPWIKEPWVLIGDEVHKLQNPDSIRRQKWNLLSDVVWRRGGFLRGLTGTEVSNGAEDIWNILQALKLEEAAFSSGRPEFFTIFKDFLTADKGRKKPPTGAVLERCHRVLRHVRISRMIEHVLPDLPKPEFVEIKVILDEQALEEIDEAVQWLIATRKALEDAQQGVIPNPNGKRKVWDGAKHVLKPLHDEERDRRRKIYEDRVAMYYEVRPWVVDDELKKLARDLVDNKASPVEMTELSRVRAQLAHCKIGTLKKVVTEHEPGGVAEYRIDLPRGQVDPAGRPLIVFSQHAGILEEAFSDRPGWAVIHGGVKQKDRPRLVHAFQRGEVAHGLGLTIVANAEAINLTRSSRVCFVDRHWNPANNDQALRRVIRPGQNDTRVIVYHIETDHAVDKLVDLTIREKSTLAKALKDREASMEGLNR